MALLDLLDEPRAIVSGHSSFPPSRKDAAIFPVVLVVDDDRSQVALVA